VDQHSTVRALRSAVSQQLRKAATSDDTSNGDNGQFVNSDFLEQSTIEQVVGGEEEDLEEVGASVTILPPSLAAVVVSPAEDSTSSPERVPRVVDPHRLHPDNNIKSNHRTKETTTEDNGLYQEVNPGQYHEVNPGQYTEVNPGQYTEVNPGQYTEVNPGQYEEVHPGQDLKIDDVKVDVANKDQTKIYNVQANVGDYIIGEVGKINVSNGQTFQGVRYTAVDGYEKHITDILSKYFGTRTR